MVDDVLRQVDAEIHRKVFGNRVCVSGVSEDEPGLGNDWFDAKTLVPVPFYSTDIAAAWSVMLKLRERDCDVGIESCGAAWSVSFLGIYHCPEKTPELAICRAALKWLAERALAP